MSIKAYFTYSQNKVTLSYESFTNPDYLPLEYLPGDNVIDFIYLDIEEQKNAYEKLIQELTAICFKEANPFGEFHKLFYDLDSVQPMLFFYNHMLHETFGFLYLEKRFELSSGIKDLHKCDIYIPDEFTPENVENFLNQIISAIIIDIEHWQKKILKEFERIYAHSEDKDFKKLLPEQKLYYLDRVLESKQFQYTNSELLISLIHPSLEHSNEIIPKDDFAGTIMAENYCLKEAYIATNIEQWAKLDFYKLIMLDIPFLKCGNCGRYFFSHGRKDVKYCSRISEGETQPCEIIGATRVYNSKVAGDPVHAAYGKAYKRMNSRVRYGNLSREDFYDWSEESRVKRRQCYDGEITLEELELWLGNRRRKNNGA